MTARRVGSHGNSAKRMPTRLARKLPRRLTTDVAPPFGAIAAPIARNGYRPLPIRPRSKIPAIEDWPNYTFAPKDLERFPNAGVGILCGPVIGVDIDVRDEKLAAEIERLVVKMLGVAPRRIGQPPKVLRLFRVEGEQFGKLSTAGYRLHGDEPEDKPHRVEILVRGQQFVAYNLHPDTGKPYRWNGAGDPLTVPVSKLTAVTRQQLQDFLRRAEAILGRRGKRAGKLAQLELGEREERTDSELRAQAPAMLREALEHIPNDDLDYDSWIKVCYAVKGALGDDGLDAWLAWSAKAERKDDPKESRRVFQSAKDPRSGAGTIYWLAEQYSWKRPRASRRGRPSTATQLVDLMRLALMPDRFTEATQLAARTL